MRCCEHYVGCDQNAGTECADPPPHQRDGGVVRGIGCVTDGLTEIGFFAGALTVRAVSAGRDEQKRGGCHYRASERPVKTHDTPLLRGRGFPRPPKEGLTTRCGATSSGNSYSIPVVRRLDIPTASALSV